MRTAENPKPHDSLGDDISRVRAQCYEALDHLRAALDHLEHFHASRSHIGAALQSTVRAIESLPAASAATTHAQRRALP